MEKKTGPYFQVVAYNVEDDLSANCCRQTALYQFFPSKSWLHSFSLRLGSIFGNLKNIQAVTSHFYSNAGILYTEDITADSCSDGRFFSGEHQILTHDSVV